jgi:hypothetical protein
MEDGQVHAGHVIRQEREQAEQSQTWKFLFGPVRIRFVNTTDMSGERKVSSRAWDGME